MQRSIVSVAAAILCFGWMFSTHPAAAQGQPQTPNITDQKLDQTAAAIQNVERVHTAYRQKLSAATPDDQDKIISEGNAALEKAVTDQGLSPDEYNSIIQVAQNDPSVRNRLVERLGAMKRK
jgi:hypothetical protein